MKADDGHTGGTDTQLVTIIIKGTDDAPVITVGAGDSDSSPLLIESNAALTASGTLTVSDADLSDTVTPTVDAVALSGVTGGLTSADVLGMLTVSPASIAADRGDVHNLSWAFNSTPQAFNFLAANETLTLSYTVKADNGHTGGTDTQLVTIIIKGTDDAPVITVGAGDSDSSPLLIESNAALTASGTLTVSDADLSDTVTPTVDAVALSGVTGGLTSADVLGMLTVSPASIAADPGDVHNLSWAFNSTPQAFNFLAANETLTLSYTVKADDGHTGGTDTQLVTIIIKGTDDAPVITAQDLIGAVTEQTTPAGNLTDSGIITFTDVDLTDVHLVSPTGTPIGSVLGTLTAVKNADTTGTGTGGQLTWTYTVADSAVEYLAAGQTKVESFTITLDDQNGGLITKQIDVTIHGTDDAPVLAVVATASAYTKGGSAVPVLSAATVTDVDNTTLASATVTITDFVAGDVLAFTNTSSTTYGNITASYNAAGVLTLTSAGATATLAQWQAALDAVQYSSTSSDPTASGSDTSRTISWVVNDGTLPSVAQTTTLNITAPTVVTIAATDTLNLNGGTLQTDFIQVDGTLSGWGTITANVIEIGTGGKIVANSSHTLTVISGSITGTGTLEIANNTTLTLEGPVGSGLTVQFDIGQGAVGTLVLADPSEFYAQISGFDANDTIDLANLDFNTALANSSYDSSTDITTLVITDTQQHTYTLKLEGNYTASTWTFSNDGSGGAIMVDPPASTTTTDATAIPVVETTATLTTTDTAGGQTDVSPATVGDGTVVALDTAISDPDGDATTSATVSGNAAVAQTTGTVLGSSSLMVNPGAALQFNSISHRVGRIFTDNGAVEVINPPTLARKALSRPGTLTIFEGQTAIVTIIIVVEYLAENFKLANDAHAGVLIADSPTSSDLALASLSETPPVTGTDTADTHASWAAGDDGTHVGLDAAPPAAPVLPDHGGDKPAVAHDTIPIAYLEATGLGHEASKGHITALTATASVEGRTAAKPVVAVSSHATSGETESDGNRGITASLSSSDSSNIASMDARASAAAPVHSVAAEQSWMIDSAGAAVGHGDSASLQGAASEHGNDQPQLASADPGTLQSLESPSQTAAPAVAEIPLTTAAVEMPLATTVGDSSAGAAAPIQSVAEEQSSTIGTASAAIGQSDAAGLEGAASEHGNDQPHLSAHAAANIPLAAAVDDANASAAAHGHGAAAEHSSAMDASAAAVGHGDSARLEGAPMQAPRPMVTVPPRNTRRRSKPLAQQSGKATPRARRLRPPLRNYRARPPCTRLWKFHRRRPTAAPSACRTISTLRRRRLQSGAPMETLRPLFTLRPRSTPRRSIPWAQPSRMATLRACKGRPLGM